MRRRALVAAAAIAVLSVPGTAWAADCNHLTPTIVDSDGDGDGVIFGTSGDDVIDALGGDDLVFGMEGNDTICGRDGLDILLGGDGSLTGTDGNDDLFGEAGDDLLRGEPGDDLLDGGADDDTLGGDDGEDLIGGQGGSDNAGGGADSDQIFGGPGDDSDAGGTIGLFGGDGDDVIGGGAGTDLVEGGADSDTITGDGGNDITTGAGPIGYLAGGTGIDQIDGSSGNDLLIGEEGADTLHGDADRDLLMGLEDADTLDGDDGIDTASFNEAPGPVTVNLGPPGTASGAAGNDSLIEIENLLGSNFNDHLTGDGGANNIEGELGNDVIDGAGSASDSVDHLDATAGVTVNLGTGTTAGAAGNDTLARIEWIYGSHHADTLTGDANPNVIGPRGGNDAVDGVGSGNLVDYSVSTPSGVTVDLAAGQAAGGTGTDTLVAIQQVFGSAFGDQLLGDGNSNGFEGGAGDDLIDGRDPGEGDDTDLYLAGSGAGPLSVSLQAGTARSPRGGHDQVANLESVSGSDEDDVLIGDDDRNVLAGGAGNDQAYGKGGEDVLAGGPGTDRLDGGAGVANIASYVGEASVEADLAAGRATAGGATDALIGIEGLYGTAGNDQLLGDAAENVFSGGPGYDLMDGRGGLDYTGYFPIPVAAEPFEHPTLSATGPVTIDLSSGTATDAADGSTDTLRSINLISGSDGDDTLLGSNRADAFLGEGGNDVIRGLGGGDLLDAGRGSDTVDGGAGRDYLTYAIDPSGPITADLGKATVTSGVDTDSVSGLELLGGTEGDDMIKGSKAKNLLFGEGGNDVIRGLAGGDTIDPGPGRDVANGGTGFDHCVRTPGAGRDRRRACESKRLPASQRAIIAAIEAFKLTDGGHRHGNRIRK